MFQWHGGGLPSVYRVLRPRFWTCGAKRLSGVVFIIKFDQRLFLPLTLITFHWWGGGSGDSGGCAGSRGPLELRPHAGRWRAAFIISLRKQMLYYYKAVSQWSTEPLKNVDFRGEKKTFRSLQEPLPVPLENIWRLLLEKQKNSHLWCHKGHHDLCRLPYLFFFFLYCFHYQEAANRGLSGFIFNGCLWIFFN